MYYCRQHPEDYQKAIIESKFDKIHISNGLEWSLDGKTFYYIDSLAFKVEAFDYEASGGVLSNRRTVFDLKKENIQGNPDGMTIDTRGHLWVAIFFGAKVNLSPCFNDTPFSSRLSVMKPHMCGLCAEMKARIACLTHAFQSVVTQ